MTEETVRPRQAAAGTVLFWLLLPIVVAGGIGAMIHYYVPIVNGWAAAFFMYALGTFGILWKFTSKWVRIPILILNLSLFVVFGWFQMGSFFPDRPWAYYLGAVLVGLTWIGFAYLILSKRGKRAQKKPNMQLVQDDQRSLAEKIQSGDVDVKERIIAALKLAGNRGDMTVDAARILEKMSVASEASHIQARADAAQAIIAAFQAGLIPDDLEVNAQLAIAKLLDIKPNAAEELLEGDDQSQAAEVLSDTIIRKMKWT